MCESIVGLGYNMLRTIQYWRGVTILARRKAVDKTNGRVLLYKVCCTHKLLLFIPSIRVLDITLCNS